MANMLDIKYHSW